MAVLTTPAVAATVTALIAKIRRALGDTQSSAAGQKFSNTDILAAADDTIAEMTVEMYEDAGPFIEEVSFAYTADARSVALPAGREASSIYKIEDITVSATTPTFLDYLDAIDLDRDDFIIGWTYLGNAIAVRPKPAAAMTLRISFLKYYIPISGSAPGSQGTDQHSMSANHEEVIVLGAANRLQEIDDEVPTARILRYQELWKKFQMYALRFRGPAYVRDTRSYG